MDSEGSTDTNDEIALRIFFLDPCYCARSKIIPEGGIRNGAFVQRVPAEKEEIAEIPCSQPLVCEPRLSIQFHGNATGFPELYADAGFARRLLCIRRPDPGHCQHEEKYCRYGPLYTCFGATHGGAVVEKRVCEGHDQRI